MLTTIKSFAVLAALALLLPLSQVRAADDIGQGVKAFKRGDYKKAAAILKDDAERGDQTAQFYMGFMAEEGKGMKKNTAMAIKMYEGAAGQGHARASYRLGLMYRNGEGVKKDQEMANRYFYNAAQGGDPDARKIMAARMKKGTFEMKVTAAQQAKLDEAVAAHNKDEDEKSFNLFMDLAKQDVAEAQTWVARFYHDGEGVQTNYQESANWAQKAGKLG
ncbi:MAG TPA: tetratricopeptide repeat protein, partial [bacterium]